MTIVAVPAKPHWNYFLALERDMEVVSRYIEFCDANLAVFSVELAHLLFGAASEVDVVAKLLCEHIEPSAPRSNINDYKAALVPAIPEVPHTEVFVPRYGLSFKPWSNWAAENNPEWWRSYNNVKHQRNAHFDEATLKNALNALGDLLILTFLEAHGETDCQHEQPSKRRKAAPAQLTSGLPSTLNPSRFRTITSL